MYNAFNILFIYITIIITSLDFIDLIVLMDQKEGRVHMDLLDHMISINALFNVIHGEVLARILVQGRQSQVIVQQMERLNALMEIRNGLVYIIIL